MPKGKKLAKPKPGAEAPVVLAQLEKPVSILGLDLGLSKTGWALYTSIGVSVPVMDLHCGLIRPPEPGPNDPFGEMRRLREIILRIKGLIQKPMLVVVEGFSFGSMNTQAHKIGGLGYLARYLLFSHGIPFIVVSPLGLKKFATGKTQAEKSQILKQVLKIWKVDLDDENTADAFVLSMIGRALTGNWDPETQPQREVLKSLVARNSQLLDSQLFKRES